MKKKNQKKSFDQIKLEKIGIQPRIIIVSTYTKKRRNIIERIESLDNAKNIFN